MKKYVLWMWMAGVALSITCASSSSNQFAIGSTAMICMQMQKDGATENGTYQFSVTVDEFSAIKVNGIASSLKSAGKVNSIIQFQNSNSEYSIKIADNSIEGGIYRDVLSFVINIDNGTFTKITLDNEDCSVCSFGDGTQACSAATGNQCYSKAASFSGEDPKFFISWIGTDKNGDHLLSHTKRLSRFSQYSVGSIYQSAKGLITG